MYSNPKSFADYFFGHVCMYIQVDVEIRVVVSNVPSHSPGHDRPGLHTDE